MITKGASEMQGEVKAEVCVADGGGSHGEDAEPESGVRPNLFLLPPTSPSLISRLNLDHLARVEKSCRQGVQQDCRVNCKASRSSPVVKEESHAAWKEKSSKCASSQAPTMS